MCDIFPEEFSSTCAETLGTEWDAFQLAMGSTSPVSVRWNPYKVSDKPSGREVMWSRYGRYLEQRPSFTVDPLFHAGAYYVQEASSMFVEHAVRSSFCDTVGLKILDLCAAPGGKSTLYSTLASPEGIVVANEVVRARANVLADNVRKWGIGNVIVTNNDTSHFGGLSEWFDVVAVDAPCSGEGMFRKSAEARAEWSKDNVEMCAARQRNILADAWEALKPGGVLVYSTCTFNRRENEDNVSWLADNFNCEDAGVEVPEEWNIVLTEASGIRCFRFWPHRVEGEGFFCAVLRKGGQNGRPFRPKPRKQIFADISRSYLSELGRWMAQPEFMRFAQIGDDIFGYYAVQYNDVKTISEYLNTIHSGVRMGQLFGGKLKPEHSLAMFHDVAFDVVPVVQLSEVDVLNYLRKDDSLSVDIFSEGINLVAYDNHPLGWVKRIGRRVNNLYPKSLMILNK